MSELTTSIQLAQIKARLMEIAEVLMEDEVYTKEAAVYDILSQVQSLKIVEDFANKSIGNEHYQLHQKLGK
jgi:hypothetical protein